MQREPTLIDKINNPHLLRVDADIIPHTALRAEDMAILRFVLIPFGTLVRPLGGSNHQFSRKLQLRSQLPFLHELHTITFLLTRFRVCFISKFDLSITCCCRILNSFWSCFICTLLTFFSFLKLRGPPNKKTSTRQTKQQ